MKKLLGIILALVMIVALAGGALALISAAQSGSDSGTTEAYVIIPADSNAKVKLLAANVTSDKAGSFLRGFWSSDGVSTLVDAASTGTALNVTATTGFSAGDIIGIQTPEGLIIERLVQAVVTGVSLTLSSSLDTGYGSVGDTVYKLGDSATDSDVAFPVGDATVEKTNAEGVYIAPRGSPLLLLLDSTSAGSINYITWVYK